MKNIQKLLGLSLLCASLTLVGCGGGGGGSGDGGGNAQNNQNNQVAPPPLEIVEVQDDDSVALHGVPVEEIVEESNPVVNTELIQPVENVAVLPSDLDKPGAIAANPEPTTIALGALGAVFLVSRRYRRMA